MSKNDSRKEYLFWSKWHPKIVLEVVPLKCASRQQKTPVLEPFSDVFSYIMQLTVEEKRWTIAIVKIMAGKIGESSAYADNLFPRGSSRTVHSEPRKLHRKIGEISVYVNDSFFVHRPHSTQQSKDPSQKIGESPVNADDFFAQRTSYTVHISTQQSERPLAVLLSCTSPCICWLDDLYERSDHLSASA